MLEIMQVEDSFSTKEAGIIISGVNPAFDAMKADEIKSCIGKRVRIVSPDGREVNTAVRDVAISESLIGNKNISIALGQVEEISEVSRHSMVYSLEDHVTPSTADERSELTVS
jgi:hypothetical protein